MKKHKKIYSLYYIIEYETLEHSTFSNRKEAEKYMRMYNKVAKQINKKEGYEQYETLYLSTSEIDKYSGETPCTTYRLWYSGGYKYEQKPLYVDYILCDSSKEPDEESEDDETGEDISHFVDSKISIEDALIKLNTKLKSNYTLDNIELDKSEDGSYYAE